MRGAGSGGGFLELRLDGERSIAADVPDGLRRGIYAYEFADGTWYVGKASDVRRRHAQHLHEYRHEDPPLGMERMLFMPLPGSTEAELDRAETDAIAAFEREGRDLRNVMKAGRPGGSGDLAVGVAGGFGVEIPWERARRPRAASATCGAGASNRTEGMGRRFARLSAAPWWPKLLGLLAAYAREAIPAPDALGCSLWSATAMTRSGTRSGGSRVTLCCVSVGNVEALALFDGEGGPGGFLNMKGPVGRVAACRRGDVWLREGEYRAAGDVVSAEFDSLDGLGELLSDGAVLDACYRLNAEMLRRGSCMYARNSNAFLVDAILTEVVGS